MPAISLMSFLKIMTKGSPQKIQEYGKYLKPGGYDFYWTLKDAVFAYTVNGKSFAECMKPIKAINRDVERECNAKALKALDFWAGKAKPKGYFSAPNGSCVSPAGYLTVKLEPEFGVVQHDGARRIVQAWYSKALSLNKHSVFMGTHLIQKYLCVGDYADCQAGILDLRKKHLLVVDPRLGSTLETMLASEFAWADSFFKTQSASSKAA